MRVNTATAEIDGMPLHPPPTVPATVQMPSQDRPRNMTAAPGVYVHIPFCRRKCPYCDFYSSTRCGRIPAYLDALHREMALRAAPLDADTL